MDVFQFASMQKSFQCFWSLKETGFLAKRSKNLLWWSKRQLRWGEVFPEQTHKIFYKVFITAISLWMSQSDIESQHSSKSAQFLNMPPNMAWKSKQSRFHSNKDSLFQDYTLAAVFSVLGLGLCSVLPFLGLISQSKSDSFTENLTWILSRHDICSSCSYSRLRKICSSFLFPFLSLSSTHTHTHLNTAGRIKCSDS